MRPLTPAGADLQDFPFMPLHVARLRDSDLAAEESPEACWYAVLLWAASWHQLPAGSLPDNDAVLTKLIGLGRDVRTFRKHKAGAMRGFVLCDDGRLYHEVVAEQVNAAWEGKLQQRWRSECARVKKANQRSGTNLPPPSYEAFVACLPAASRPLNVPQDEGECPEGQIETSPGTPPPCPQGNTVQERETETETETETGNLFGDADASPVASAKPTATVEPWASDVEFAKLWQVAPPEMRRRAKSKAKTWPEWRRALKATPAATILAGFVRYKAMDPDIGRTGGPGLHIWLKDRGWEQWASPEAEGPLGDDWPESRWAAAVQLWRQDASWDDRLGPTPGQPGCRVPANLLIQPTRQGTAA